MFVLKNPKGPCAQTILIVYTSAFKVAPCAFTSRGTCKVHVAVTTYSPSQGADSSSFIPRAFKTALGVRAVAPNACLGPDGSVAYNGTREAYRYDAEINERNAPMSDEDTRSGFYRRA